MKKIEHEKLGGKFSYLEKMNADFTSLRLDDGPYKGVIYTYGAVQIIVNDPEKETANVNFNFKVEEVPPILNETKEALESNEEFKTCIGKILIDIIAENMNDEKELAENNSKESDKQ